MPKVGGKKFAYTAKGMKAAKNTKKISRKRNDWQNWSNFSSRICCYLFCNLYDDFILKPHCDYTTDRNDLKNRIVSTGNENHSATR